MARSDLMRRASALLLLAPLALTAGGCTDIDNTLASVPYFAFMRNSPALDPYEMTRPAPAGAVPFHAPNGEAEAPVPLAPGYLENYAATLPANPVAATPQSLAQGQALYMRYCYVCHGPTGTGGGPIVGQGKFPPVVPNLTTAPATDRSEQYLYAIIRLGRGLMPAYGDRVGPAQRWLVVNYVRYLQRQAPAGIAPDTAAAYPWVVTLPDTSVAATPATTEQEGQ